MNEEYDNTDLVIRADEKIRTFQADAAREAGIYHLITLPTYHTAALSTDNLAKIFGEMGMLGYVKGVQRKEIRQGIACVKHQIWPAQIWATIIKSILLVRQRLKHQKKIIR